MFNVPFQYELRPEIPNVYGAFDYREFRDTIIKVDEILSKSGLEKKLILTVLEQIALNNEENYADFCISRDGMSRYKKLRHALRCNIARHLTGESYRLFSVRLADSSLLQWFTNINDFSCRKATSKSSLERYEKYFEEDVIAEKICEWLAELSSPDKALESVLHQAIEYKNIFMDSTCIKANIHFPVDWVLLRDAVRSLLLAIKTIRAKGLKHRMIEPHLLLKQMNRLCIAMTHVRRKANGKKQRKTILRTMKKLSACIAKHGKSYRQLLTNEWKKTDWTFAQTQQVIGRIDLMLGQLPAAIKQAHERIIGERIIPAAEKILSLYDKDAHVIVRGKAGNEVEFGQGLLLTEQADGLIIDWQLFSEQPPSDSKAFGPAIARIKTHYGCIDSTCADRGFSSKNNTDFLKETGIYNAICPKRPKELQEKLSDPIFLSLQTRRSQTEARIGIFKNVFLGKPLRSRITKYKRIAITWCVLTHNLWLLSRMAIEYERSLLRKAA